MRLFRQLTPSWLAALLLAAAVVAALVTPALAWHQTIFGSSYISATSGYQYNVTFGSNSWVVPTDPVSELRTDSYLYRNGYYVDGCNQVGYLVWQWGCSKTKFGFGTRAYTSFWEVYGYHNSFNNTQEGIYEGSGSTTSYYSLNVSAGSTAATTPDGGPSVPLTAVGTDRQLTLDEVWRNPNEPFKDAALNQAFLAAVNHFVMRQLQPGDAKPVFEINGEGRSAIIRVDRLDGPTHVYRLTWNGTRWDVSTP